MPLLRVQDLRTRFHIPEGTVHAVNGISFDLQECETLALVGESGCGKSVSMLSILQLIPQPPGDIYGGTATYAGLELLGLPESDLEQIRGAEISMIFQEPMTALNPVLTVGRQITESLLTHTAMSRREARDRAAALLEGVGIPDAVRRLRCYPHEFSGGQRQRVMIAMALACDPKVLIADEPTTALDVTIQAQIIELMAALRERTGMAIIWITHDLGVVAGLAQRVIVMYAGFIVEEAPVEDLYADPRHPYTRALLAALPRVDRTRRERLKSIPGAPPNLLVEPQGCPFARRCELVVERCWAENPVLTAVGPNHRAACWIDVITGVPR